MDDEDKKTEEWVAYLEKLADSSAYKRVWNYFLYLAKTDDFIEVISKLRMKYRIPPQGYSLPGVHFGKPDEWRSITDPLAERKFDKEIRKICSKFGLHFVPWEDNVLHYVFYNEIFQFLNEAHSRVLCIHEDTWCLKDEPFPEDMREADDKFYPWSIRYSPYASERDIIDFVRRTYKREIKPAQEHYIEKNHLPNIARFRKRTAQERDDFIYQNRNLTQKKIRVLVKEKFNVSLDYPYIGKIISRERKRRVTPKG